jgi:hypothetical protein
VSHFIAFSVQRNVFTLDFTLGGRKKKSAYRSGHQTLTTHSTLSNDIRESIALKVPIGFAGCV